MESKVAFITGITGQAGSIMARLLLSKGYEVHGLVRRQRNPHYENLADVQGIVLHDGDLLDEANITHIFEETKPDEIYHFASQSFVPHSVSSPEYTFQTNTLGTLHVLNAMKASAPVARLLHASTSEMFGNPATYPQTLSTPFRPVSPYGISKLAAHNLVRNYHETYGLHAVNALMFNYESPYRSQQFVTRKIAINAARRIPVNLGNINAARDWTWAEDMMTGCWKYLQLDEWREAILFASGESHSVKELATKMYNLTGGVEGMVNIDQNLMRPNELYKLVGDPSEAEKVLGWRRTKDFDGIVKAMVDAEVSRAQKERPT